MGRTVELRDDEMVVSIGERVPFEEAMIRALASVNLYGRGPPVLGSGRRVLRVKSAKTYAPNGARECARRARQIAAGSLRAENGLRSPGALLPCAAEFS